MIKIYFSSGNVLFTFCRFASLVTKFCQRSGVYCTIMDGSIFQERKFRSRLTNLTSSSWPKNEANMSTLGKMFDKDINRSYFAVEWLVVQGPMSIRDRDLSFILRHFWKETACMKLLTHLLTHSLLHSRAPLCYALLICLFLRSLVFCVISAPPLISAPHFQDPIVLACCLKGGKEK